MLGSTARKMERGGMHAGTQHTRTGRGRFWTRDRRDVRGLSKSNRIRLVTLNITSGRARGLEAALRALKQDNLDVGVLQETKLIYGIKKRQGEGYDVWATAAESRNPGGG